MQIADAPVGSAPTITVSTTGVQRVVRQSSTVDSLPTGDYRVTAEELIVDSVRWEAEPATQMVSVRAGQATPLVTVRFRRKAAAVIITESGLPSYARATVRISGPNGYSRTALTRDTVRPLVAGTYTVVAEGVETTDGRFEASENSQTISVTGNAVFGVSFAYGPAKAKLTVAVDGLPGGSVAGIVVSGPAGFSRRADATSTFAGLEPGTYRATAARISSGGFSYDPDGTSRDVTLSGTQQRTLSFNYHLSTGAIAVLIGGLPTDGNAGVTITGPAGFSRAVTSTQTLTDLAPGTYRLVAASVLVNGVSYAPSPATLDLVVAPSLVAVPAEVQYHGAVGAMAVSVAGLPPSLEAVVKVSRAGMDPIVLSGTRTLDQLPTGQYLIEAQTVSGTSDSWDPDVTSKQVQVTAGSTAGANINYLSRTGSLSVSIVGLPTGIPASVRVDGPGNMRAMLLTASTTLSGLRPGSYTLTANTVTADGNQYTVAPVASTVEVTRGATSNKTLSYGGQSTSLTIDFTGLPGGTTPLAQVTGPNGFSRTLTSAAVLDNLAPGAYRITSSRVSNATASYDASPAVIDVSLTSGQRLTRTIDYMLATGSIAVSVGGLPAGALAAISVTGPGGFAQAITGTQTLLKLVPGTYTVTARAVSAGGSTFAPTPLSRSVVVTASLVASAAPVTYASALGALRVSMSGLPAPATGAVTLLGPNGETGSLSQTSVLANLAVGNWEVRGNTVTVAGERWAATPATRTMAVVSNDTVDAPVSFARITGRLTVTVSGLPLAASGDITVTGPNAFTRIVNSTQTIVGLEPGTYTLSARSIVAGSTNYSPDVATQTVDITAGGTASRTITYGGQTTALTITVNGVPAGSLAAITVTGPNGFSQSVTASRTLTGIAAGTYTIAATRIVAGNFGYMPTPASQSITVSTGDSKSATVGYAVSTGALAVAVSGLPADLPAPITVTGPNGFSRAVSASTTLTDLAVGTYTITAGTASQGGTNFTPSAATQTVSVAAGSTAASSVAYTSNTTSLTITVSGLPNGVNSAVTVTGPNAFSRLVTASTVLSGLAPGSYTVTATAIAHEGYTWSATPPSTNVSLVAGDAKSVTITYAATTGRLTVAVSGLPAGTSAAITVTGPNGFSQAVTTGVTLQNLTPGTYTLAAANVTNASTLYTPSPVTQTAGVTAGATLSRSVTYAASGTSLTVNVSGVPAGGNAAVAVTGPNGFVQNLTATTTLNNLAAGSYTVSSASIINGGYTYTPTPASQAVALAVGEQKSANVVYAATTGRLTVSVTGLPAGANAAIVATGPNGFTQNVTATTTLSNLTVGTYTLTASNVVSAGNTYAPGVATQTVSVTAGSTASRSVTYTQQGGGDGPNLVLEGAYVTQAIQSFAGNVPLVAGRQALIRVFVTAGAANTLQPPVRVRLFEGASNFRTFTINAPNTSVPATLTEGTLSSSWNATLLASDLRAGLRIQVDVDPAGAVNEPNESDNSWPRTGTQALDVRTVAPFNVVFVPVHQSVNGLVGDVTPSNLESNYVSMTRQIFPLAQINASVRATYTTNAPVLQSNDANYAWLSVLSEMNSLRIADGSNANYYGVVNTSYGSGVAGYAYTPGKAGVGWDKLGTVTRVTAHELGHNFSRKHVAACGSGNPDPNYPYPDGIISNFGWNAGTGELVPRTITDVMGYCGTQWVSDYTWTAVMNYRGPAPAAAAFMGNAEQPSLMVWGRIIDGVVTLEPSFRVVTRPVVAERPGAYRLELRDKTGRPITSFSFDPDDIDHNANAQAFNFAVPLNSFAEVRLASVAVIGGANGTTEQVARVAAARVVGDATPAPVMLATDDNSMQVTSPEPSIARSGRVQRVTWDDAVWPLAMVRDGQTGQVLAYLRKSGDAFVPSSSSARVVFSNGVKTVTMELPIR